MNNNKAIAAYTAQINTIRMRLEALTAWTDEMGHVSPECVDWGSVGSAGHVAEILGQVCEFLQIEE